MVAYLRSLLFCLLSAFCFFGSAFAYPTSFVWYPQPASPSVTYPTPLAACKAYWPTTTRADGDPGSKVCYGPSESNPGLEQGFGYVYAAYGCNGGGTTSGDACSCTPPKVENSTQDGCSSPTTINDSEVCSDAKAIMNSTLGQPYQSVTLPGAISSGTSVCAPTNGTSGPAVGCTVNFNLDIGYLLPDGTRVTRGTIDTQGSYVSLPCNQNTVDPTKPPKADIATCPAGEQTGQINGVDTCKPYAPGTKATSVEKVDTSKAGTGATTTNKTTTVCDSVNCTSTTITSTTANSTVTTATSTVSKNEFCTAKPASAQCEAVGAGGSGDGGEEGSGCEDGADTIGCAKFGQPGEQGETSNSNVALTFSRESGFGASDGTCPAPRVLNIPGGRTISMSFDLYCDFARGMRPFIIGFALLSAAGMVVFSATRKG